ncbi:hypothetical protein F511_18221 [Dorcoceras hygrometricum]|uniref:Splicing factor 3B subunit 1-like n=1 Tax=Dorcoceras hygrometricum TaxID=472368 RepID=A0A2Z7BGE5_9LAMI|nr:hypothetical protein F511_18221 [Dorcoceras hygrometricum]
MDNSEMVAMFEALVESGLNDFLGFQGKLVEISEEFFARNFQLPVEGLIDIHEVPKDLIFYARTEFLFTGEQLTTSCKKRELKIEYRLLSDIVAKSITVKAGSFDAVTHERFLLMTAIFGGVSVNWGRLLFKIFKDMVTPETRQARGYAVHICILLKNIPDLELGDSEEKISGEENTCEKVVSKKRPAVAEREQPHEIDVREETVAAGQAVEKADEIEHWFDLSYEEFIARRDDRIVESASETDEEQETVAYETGDGEQQLQTFLEPEVAKEIEMEIVLADPVITKSDDILVEVDESSAATTAKDIDLEIVTDVEQLSSDEELMSIDDLLKRIP